MAAVKNRITWLRGQWFHCLIPPRGDVRPWRLVLLGPPGAGRSVQARRLADVLGACPLSTAEVFRDLSTHSPTLETAYARERIASGALVADDYVLEIIHNRRACLRCQAGFLLDGFPRTLVQAASLDALLEADHVALDAVISYELPFADLLARVKGRLVCPNCLAVYEHDGPPPREPGLCNQCGRELFAGAAGDAAVTRGRLEEFVEANAQVAAHYRHQGLLVSVPAGGSPDTVMARTLALLAERGFVVPRPT